jgi:hypothetical protein
LGNWLALELRQDGANRDGIGAWVEVAAGDSVERREVTVGGGHAGGQLGWIHFGLGEASSATVTVTWPDGQKSAPMQVGANQFGVVDRQGGFRHWTPTAGEHADE